MTKRADHVKQCGNHYLALFQEMYDKVQQLIEGKHKPYCSCQEESLLEIEENVEKLTDDIKQITENVSKNSMEVVIYQENVETNYKTSNVLMNSLSKKLSKLKQTITEKVDKNEFKKQLCDAEQVFSKKLFNVEQSFKTKLVESCEHAPTSKRLNNLENCFQTIGKKTIIQEQEMSKLHKRLQDSEKKTNLQEQEIQKLHKRIQDVEKKTSLKEQEIQQLQHEQLILPLQQLQQGQLILQEQEIQLQKAQKIIQEQEMQKLQKRLSVLETLIWKDNTSFYSSYNAYSPWLQ